MSRSAARQGEVGTEQAVQRTAVTIPVRREEDVSAARGAALALAEEIGLTRPDAYGVGTSVSELAANLVCHTPHGGQIRIAMLRCGDRKGIEIVAEDHGPGIADVGLAMQDGFSTNGGLGGGLPGSRRLMDEFDITSALGRGTRVVARKWSR